MSLIPFASSELATGVSPMLLSYGPTPAQVASTLYKDAKWVGRKAAKAMRKTRTRKAPRKRSKASDVGEPMKIVHLKREQTFVQTDIATNTRTLYDNEITALGGGNGEDERHRQLINCKGIEVCYHYYNIGVQPKFVNIAIIAPKHTTSGVSTADFFRSNSGDRGTNFSTALSALELHYLPINTDIYTVLRHYRHQVGAQADSPQYNSDTGPANFISKKIWLPVNRQLRYDNTLATSCSTPIYVCWWFDRMRTPPGQAVATGQGNFSFMHTMFYTDVL